MKKNDDSILKWHEISRKKILDCRIFSVYSSKVRSYNKKETEAFSLEAPDWVTVIPVLWNSETENFLLVRQYRHGSREITIEFPAGTVDKNELPRDAAIRELLEETGYRAGEIIQIGSVNPNPAFMNNTLFCFVASGLEKVQGQKLDEHEIVDYEMAPVKEIEKKMGTGQYSNGTMMIALAYYWRWKYQVK